MAQKKADHHAVGEHNLRCSTTLILAEPEIGFGDDKKLIFFAIMFMLNIFCDIINDFIDNTGLRRIQLSG